MRQRIARHQRDRSERVPGLRTLEEPLRLAQAITAHSRPDTLLVIDCLTLWLTNLLMPAEGAPSANLAEQQAQLLRAIDSASGPLVLVGNEIGLGVIPLGREVRAFVDALGRLNQDVARTCARVTLMAAGLPLTLKEGA
jgi:adenosylcobinamide kinase/adenosylcobinamide-phosphate guanylyltransferase